MKENDPKRMQRLAQLIAMYPNQWRWPKFRAGSRKYPHHNEQEMARRRDQRQHQIQVKVDRETKPWPNTV